MLWVCVSACEPAPFVAEAFKDKNNTKLPIYRVSVTWTDRLVLIIVSVFIVFEPISRVCIWCMPSWLYLDFILFFHPNHHTKQYSHPAGSPGGDQCADAPHSHCCTFSALLTGVLFLSLATQPCISRTLTLPPSSTLRIPQRPTLFSCVTAADSQHCGVLHACPDLLSSPLYWRSEGSGTPPPFPP